MLIRRLYAVVEEMGARIEELAKLRRGWVEELALLHALQVQALLDMVMRLAIALGHAPETPRDAARRLAIAGVLSFRDILVHQYMDVDWRVVEDIVANRRYAEVVALAKRLLSEAEARGLDP